MHIGTEGEKKKKHHSFLLRPARLPLHSLSGCNGTRWLSVLLPHHAAFGFDVPSPQITVFLLIKDGKESKGKEEKHFLKLHMNKKPCSSVV